MFSVGEGLAPPVANGLISTFREDQGPPLPPPPKDEFEEYARKVINRAYFIILNKIDELDGTNDKLIEYYYRNLDKFAKYGILNRQELS